MRRIILWSVTAFLLLSTAGLGAIGWVGSERALHPGYYSYNWNLATFPDLHPEHIQVRCADKIFLAADFFAAIVNR